MRKSEERLVVTLTVSFIDSSITHWLVSVRQLLEMVPRPQEVAANSSHS